MTTYRILISSNALHEHLQRLYCVVVQVKGMQTLYHHVDGIDAGVVSIRSESKTTATTKMSCSAIKELIADLEYQIEFATERYERDYRNQCKRALSSINKQLARRGTDTCHISTNSNANN
jgi:hypothetical protein